MPSKELAHCFVTLMASCSFFFRESLDQAPPGFYPAPIFRTPGPFHRGLINCETVLPTENGNALKVKADIRLIYLNPTAGW